MTYASYLDMDSEIVSLFDMNRLELDPFLQGHGCLLCQTWTVSFCNILAAVVDVGA